MIDKQEIKSRLSLPAVIEYCTGEPIPRSGMIHCPFHDDRNPSLKVYKDGWYCFGCHRYGDVIQWVEEWENVDFTQALRVCNALLSTG